MHINIGSNRLIKKRDIIGIFDLDTASHEKETKDFLKIAEKEKNIEVCRTDLPKSFVVVSSAQKKQRKNGKKHTVFLTTLSSASLAGRNK